MYTATTRNICVTVTPRFIEEQSDPDTRQYVWAYHVKLENQGPETVQLISRYWHITDGLGQVTEVRGPGVVGEQPTLGPGQSFEYTSGTPLPTTSGIMVGRYQMETGGGEEFEIDIPAFSLDSPYDSRRLN